MERKVAQTELDPAEYETLVVAARKSGLTLKEILRIPFSTSLLGEGSLLSLD
jgi:hypothetical protein